MITTADFKKQIARSFGQEMRLIGFKGTGLEYLQDSINYQLAVYISPSRWGASCSVGFAIHPKQIDYNDGGGININRFKPYQYEFKFSLRSADRNGSNWKYAGDQAANLITLSEMLDTIKSRIVPVINMFKASPDILDQFEVSEMDDFHDNWTKRTGVAIATTEFRFAWAMTVIFEKKNIYKAKQFANWAVAHWETEDTDWFGYKDFQRVLAKNNGV